jgi:methionyl aminopeptidase
MKIKSDADIAVMRTAGHKLAVILSELETAVLPGATGKEISKLASELIKREGVQPILLGFQGFPDVMCISLNEAVVHGIPSSKSIKEGDVVKLDLAIAYKSLIVDSAITVIAGGKPDNEVAKLLKGTKEAMYAGIDAISGAGTRVGDIASAVQKVLDSYNLGIVRDLVGHGVGYSLHEDPNVPNYGVAGTGPTLSAGMTIAVEPMATLGEWQVQVLDDNWTIVSRDSSLTAHFEHTVLITEKGYEILTAL